LPIKTLNLKPCRAQPGAVRAGLIPDSIKNSLTLVFDKMKNEISHIHKLPHPRLLRGLEYEVRAKACLLLSSRLLVAIDVDRLKCLYSVIILEAPDENWTVHGCCWDTLTAWRQDLFFGGIL
jgi:hypothetical protein